MHSRTSFTGMLYFHNHLLQFLVKVFKIFFLFVRFISYLSFHLWTQQLIFYFKDFFVHILKSTEIDMYRKTTVLRTPVLTSDSNPSGWF